MPPLRAVGYVRVSTTQQQTEGVSLEAQQQRIRDYCASRAWHLVKVYKDTASAKDDNRPGLQALLKAVTKGAVDAVVIVKGDRLIRSVQHLGSLVTMFLKHHVALVSITEGIDATNATGRLNLNILGAVAQWEREIISERTKEALAYQKTQGRVYGRIPYGFTRQGGRLVPAPIPEPMAVVRDIFIWHRQGKSLRGIARSLTCQGIPSPRGLSRWNAETISIILNNAALYNEAPAARRGKRSA